jgi:hypothetical protein
MECLPGDFIRWQLSVLIDDNQERAAGLTPVQRLASVLAPYQPERWFNADNVPADDHHVIRYVPWAKLRKDEDDNVIGVLWVAFRLRDDEEYLSATWMEFFPGTKSICVKGAVQAIRASNMTVSPKSGFAIGNVRAVKTTCAADRQKHKIRIIHEREDDNHAHAALRGWPRDNEDLLNLIADDIWNETVLNKNIP